MDPICTSLETHGKRTSEQEAAPSAYSVRRRTLGVCAHCRHPVSIEDEYVRLYRRAWHLECALASGPSPVRSVD